MSDGVGYVLLGSAAVPMLVGWRLSVTGLNGKIEQARSKAEEVSDKATQAVKSAQKSLATAAGDDAQALATKTSDLVAKTSDLSDGIGDVSDALKTMTGPLAPARVCFSLAFLLVLGAFVAFKILTLGG